MLQLVNISNYASDLELIENSTDCLQTLLNQNHLDGLEMMLCGPVDEHVHKKEWIQGVHLKFWPCWLDFWREDHKEVLRQFGSVENIEAYYGASSPELWLELYRDNIRLAIQAGAKYLVFHVSHARTAELFTWQFSASDRQVIEASIQVINELVDEIPNDTALLFENLWWPGLTLQNRELTAMLLEGVKHDNVGIMLDTGHLMNGNMALKTEIEGVDYILEVLAQLGSYSRYIRGIHLHHSLSSQYVQQSRCKPEQDYTMAEVMNHVLKIDQHLPFSTPAVQRIIEHVQPEYLVHEFMHTSLEEWMHKITQQQQALMYKVDK